MLAASCRFPRAGRCRGRRRQRRTDRAFRPPIRYAVFSVTWRLSARLPVRREAYSTHLRQTGLRLEPGCSERRGRDGRLRRFCRATPPWCLSPGLPVRREAYSTHLRQTGLRLELGCSERRGRDATAAPLLSYHAAMAGLANTAAAISPAETSLPICASPYDTSD